MIQVSLVPPPCDEFTTSEPSCSATLAQRRDLDILPVENERTQIDMPRHDVVADDRRAARERDHGLCDEFARIGADGFGKAHAFSGCRIRSHQHAVAARLIGILDDEFVEMVEHVPALISSLHKNVGTLARIGSSLK